MDSTELFIGTTVVWDLWQCSLVNLFKVAEEYRGHPEDGGSKRSETSVTNYE